MSLRNLIRRNTGLMPNAAADPFAALQQELNRTFDSFFDGKDWLTTPTGVPGLNPKLDVSETDAEVHITAELPGMAESDIDVELTDESLKIRGEKKDERETKEHNFHRMERTFGMFERVIPLPAKVNREAVAATFKNGVLNVTLPKLEPTVSHQKIAVQAG